jgi:uncharacterized protein YkwD
MSLRATCSSCNQKFNAPDNLAGKTIKCPKCGGRVTIPGAIMPTAPGKPNSGIKPTRPSAIPRNSKLPQPAATAPPKKSRGKVLLFVLLGVGVFACCVPVTIVGAGALYFWNSASNFEWREFASNEGGFKVLMPGKPNQGKNGDSQLADDGAAVHEFVAKGLFDTTYKVQFFDLKEPPLNGHLYCTQLKDKLLGTNPEAKEASSQESSLQEHKGIEFSADLPNSKSVSGRAYVVDKRVYILTAEAPQALAATDEIKKFFDSFALTLPPAVAQAKPRTEEPAKPKTEEPAPKTKPVDPTQEPLVVPKDPPEKPKIDVPEPAKPGGKADAVKMSAEEQKLFELINKFREGEKQPKLKERQRLFDEARKGADFLAKKQQWVRDPQRYGYRQIFHLTLPAPDGFGTPQQMFDDLVSSKSTRRTLLDEFEDIGIGMASGGGITYYVLILGGNSDD